MPMKTTWESRPPSSRSSRAASIAWSTISWAARFRPKGPLPVAQKGHPIGHPTWEEMQSVARCGYRMTTASTV
jgi:hypothetical protein